ncbi:tyrosine-type recombinase/integrase [Paenibacillus shenyangensis]|uniref:tyrosine-type recombinase/integrase n=1 Tax=Paenibacillus sp. A9 TaxID=1284352 RepID=UPI0003696814|nr:tyrosine-type recombinase/integrase [Paenibacillus sp. A9]
MNQVIKIPYEGESRWIVVDKHQQMIKPIMKYIKYLDQIGRAANTLKSYAYQLKIYWDFLMDIQQNYESMDLNLLAKFMAWLRNPLPVDKVSYMQSTTAKRRERTINLMVQCVINFYDYLHRIGEFEKNIKVALTKQIKRFRHSYRPFLDHTSQNHTLRKNILKVKEPRRAIKTLTKQQLLYIESQDLHIRDQLIIRILLETGIRASELLRLELDDFDIGNKSILIRVSKTKAGENRLVYITAETMNLFQNYLLDFHCIHTWIDRVFFNRSGKYKGEAMTYESLQALIKRLNKRTGLSFTAHMFRHTCATQLYERGMSIAALRKLIGHAHIQTTLHMYVHPSEDQIRSDWQQAMSNDPKEPL